MIGATAYASARVTPEIGSDEVRVAAAPDDERLGAVEQQFRSRGRQPVTGPGESGGVIRRATRCGTRGRHRRAAGSHTDARGTPRMRTAPRAIACDHGVELRAGRKLP